MAAPSNNQPVPVCIVFDYETGGLKCQDCACTQISLHAVRLDTFETFNTYNTYIYPYNYKDGADGKVTRKLKSKYEVQEPPMMKYEEKALTYSAISMQTLYAQGKQIEDVGAEIIQFFKDSTLSKGYNNKPFLCGQNVLFDIGFLQQLMAYSGQLKEFGQVLNGRVDFWGNFQPYYVDTIVLSQLALAHTDMPSYKLEILCEKLGIELNDAHDADADVNATAAIINVLGLRMRNEKVGDGNVFVADANQEKTRKHFLI